MCSCYGRKEKALSKWRDLEKRVSGLWDDTANTTKEIGYKFEDVNFELKRIKARLDALESSCSLHFDPAGLSAEDRSEVEKIKRRNRLAQIAEEELKSGQI
jgi:hypothetical protein